MRNILLILLTIFLLSCQNLEEKQIKMVLALSGNNRPELEKVLEHYKENDADSLKLKAARFLIPFAQLPFCQSLKAASML